MKSVTLDTIGGGALAEMFAAELNRVIANIDDPNTDTKTKRQITIAVSFSPNRDRDKVKVDLKVGSKLAGIQTVETDIYVGRHLGKLVAVESDTRQGKLFDQPAAGPVAAVANFPNNNPKQE